MAELKKLTPAVGGTAAPVQAAPAKPVMPELTSKTLQKSQSNSLMLILGKPKHGKTTTGFTLSEQFSMQKALNGEAQTISDLGIITLELGALDGPRAMGVELADNRWYDLTEYVRHGSQMFNKIHVEAIKRLRELAQAGEIKGVLYDGASSFDDIQNGLIGGSMDLGKWGLLDATFVEHRKLIFEQLATLPCPVVITGHLRTPGEMPEAKREAAGIDADDRYTLAMKGWQAPSLWRKHASLIIPIWRTQGKSFKEDKFALYPRGIFGVESGGRYAALLEQHTELPPDFQYINKLIRKQA